MNETHQFVSSVHVHSFWGDRKKQTWQPQMVLSVVERVGGGSWHQACGEGLSGTGDF